MSQVSCMRESATNHNPDRILPSLPSPLVAGALKLLYWGRTWCSPATAPETMAVGQEDRLPIFSGKTRKLMDSPSLFPSSAVEKLTHCPEPALSTFTTRRTTGARRTYRRTYIQSRHTCCNMFVYYICAAALQCTISMPLETNTLPHGTINSG